MGVYLINTLEDIKLREEKQQLTLALPQINGLSQVWWVKCILRYITPSEGVERTTKTQRTQRSSDHIVS
ncbi:hypothetical protein C789_5420 [Microcystis aeruginosa FACHB-905 = DIANCHI905]|uniref:Uncharacterized protein n=1 Tax=Microcystis aeruginosa PCC 7806SL TaxID=1903187 RepID=A0AB33BQV5_MICA7|nr:hypothetical protein BH695_2686 [Microcystis aeruginosa PCC 7806SL]ELS44790.1 hypothetical protein C789_5420 [Microcystis aeruginosa FACHB-905 = DIANCHI905]